MGGLIRDTGIFGRRCCRGCLVLAFWLACTALAQAETGNLWAWGQADEGVLGFAGQLQAGCPRACQMTPTQAVPALPFVQVSGGNYFSIGLKADGTVWVWGFNADGIFGAGFADYSVSFVPLQVPGLSGISRIAAGAKHALALGADGTVWAWGSNFNGETGASSQDCLGERCMPAPVRVAGPGGSGQLSGVADIRAGVFFGVALKADGTVWAWGDNSYGNLGNGSVQGTPYPVQVLAPSGRAPLSSVTAIGLGSQSEHVLAVRGSGQVYGWGDNHREQLGQKCAGPFCASALPVPIARAWPATRVTTGWGTSFIVMRDGTARALGDNEGGGLGLGTTPRDSCGSCVRQATTVPGLTAVADIVAGFTGTLTSPLALRLDGSVMQVSGGSFKTLPAPTAVSAIGVGGVQLLALSNEVQPVLLQLEPAQIVFPDTPLGTTSAPVAFTVSNPGTAPVALLGLAVTNADPNHDTYGTEFVPTPAFGPVTLMPGDSRVVPVTFTPTRTGCAQALLVFATDAPHAPTSVYARGCPQLGATRH